MEHANFSNGKREREMINSYSFGRIVIDGKQYDADVIIFPDRVEDDWWRREGHQLTTEDLKQVLKEKPEVLVVGTGYAGLMKVLPETREYLKSEGIQLIAEKTRKACEIYNQLSKYKRVIAALHLTC